MKFICALALFAVGCACFAQSTDAFKADSLFRVGLKFHEVEDYKRACVNYSASIARGNNTYGVFYNRGICYSQLNILDSALIDMRSALDRNSRDSTAYYVIATIFARSQQYDSALAVLNTLLAITENVPHSLALRGQILLGNKDTVGACADFTKAAARGDAEATKLKRLYCEDLVENLVINLSPEDKWKQSADQADQNQRVLTYTRLDETLSNWKQLYSLSTMKQPLSDVTPAKQLIIEQAKEAAKTFTVKEVAQDQSQPPKWTIFATETSEFKNGTYPESNLWLIRLGEVTVFLAHLDVKSATIEPRLLKKWTDVFLKTSIR